MARIYYKDKLIETFIFDLDGTAFGYDGCVSSINAEGKVLEYVCNRFNSLQIEEIYDLSQKSINIDRREWFSNLIRLIIKNYPAFEYGLDIEAFAKELETLYWITFTQLNTPFYDFVYFVETIKPLCKLGVITDGYISNQKMKIFSSGLQKYFELNNVVFSDEINRSKPSIEIFEYAQKKIGYDSKTSAYVGDVLSKDIAGANSADLLSIFLRRGKNFFDSPKNQLETPQITITNYYDLLNLLDIK